MNFFWKFLRAILRLRSENVILSADRVVEREGRRTRARSLHFEQFSLMLGSLPSHALVQMSLRLNTSPPLIMLANNL